AETWFVDTDNYMKDLEESAWCDGVSGCGTGGIQTAYRCFRQVNTGRKGFAWMPMSFTAPSASWNVSQYNEEYWTYNGQPACWGTTHTTKAGTVVSGTIQTVALNGFLEDRRPGANYGRTYNVDAIQQTFYWGTAAETHYYGRYIDPSTGNWIRVGEVNYGL